MANLNSSIRIKKLYDLKEDIDKVVKDIDGIVKLPRNNYDEIEAEDDIYDLIYDHAKYSTLKPLLKHLEDLRKDVEDIHSYLSTAFGLDPRQASSQGPRGPQGVRGLTGATGPRGPQGPAGKDGNSHLEHVINIQFNDKEGFVELTLKDYKEPFRIGILK